MGKVNVNSGGFIKSIKRYEVEIPYGDGSILVAIQSVDLSKSVVRKIYSTAAGSDQDLNESQCLMYFTSSTEVKVERYDGSQTSCKVSFEVIEYIRVKSLQIVWFSTGSTTPYLISEDINQVNVNKTQVFYSYKHSHSEGEDSTEAYLSADGTKLYLEEPYSDGKRAVAYVVEHY